MQTKGRKNEKNREQKVVFSKKEKTTKKRDKNTRKSASKLEGRSEQGRR